MKVKFVTGLVDEVEKETNEFLEELKCNRHTVLNIEHSVTNLSGDMCISAMILYVEW